MFPFFSLTFSNNYIKTFSNSSSTKYILFQTAALIKIYILKYGIDISNLSDNKDLKKKINKFYNIIPVNVTTLLFNIKEALSLWHLEAVSAH